MRSAVSIVGTAFGVFAGIGSVEHGVFEILQGDVRPEGIMISPMGPPCVPEEIWNACEPAMTLIPNFLVTGILAIPGSAMPPHGSPKRWRSGVGK